MTYRRSSITKLISEYKNRRYEIVKRLAEFKRPLKGKYEEIFQELCFCILTANANALYCDEAIKDLKRSGLLFKGGLDQIRPKLRGRVRFHNKKAEFLICARKADVAGRLESMKNVFKLRDWLVENIKGYGYKEASHFLRNIGLGKDIAILDRHILKNLERYGVIKKIPRSLGSRNVYMEIEDAMRRFSKRIGIKMDELDLLFWSIQTGYIFK